MDNKRTNRNAAANKGFAIVRGAWFADIFVQDGSSVLLMKFRAKTPRHRKARNVMVYSR